MDKDVVYTLDEMFVSHKEHVLPFVTTWMDLEDIC